MKDEIHYLKLRQEAEDMPDERLVTVQLIGGTLVIIGLFVGAALLWWPL